jgi:hypothetical protein
MDNTETDMTILPEEIKLIVEQVVNESIEQVVEVKESVVEQVVEVKESVVEQIVEIKESVVEQVVEIKESLVEQVVEIKESVIKQVVKLEVKYEELKQEDKSELVQMKYHEIIELSQLLLSTNDKFTELMSKAKININESQSVQIKNTLNYLNNETNGKRPINNIIDETLKVLADNKVELYEIPQLINVIHETFKNTSSITLKTSDLGILIKLILFMLIETKLIKMQSEDYELISKVIDTSMILLNTSVQIKLPKFNKCFCFI